MKALSAFSFLLFLGVAQSCRFNPQGHQNLDFERYQGLWYLLETGSMTANETEPYDCSKGEFIPTGNTFLYEFTWHGQKEDGEVEDFLGTVALPEMNMQSHMKLFLHGTVFSEKVLATDYTTFALEYSCNEVTGFERFMIRSRTTILSSQVRQTLHSILEGYGVNPADFDVIGHGNCMK